MLGEEIRTSRWLDLKHQDGHGSSLLLVQCFWLYRGTYDPVFEPILQRARWSSRTRKRHGQMRSSSNK